jgi:hypothetical protein
MKVEKVGAICSYFKSISNGCTLVLVYPLLATIGSRSLGVEFLTLVYYSYEFSCELLLLLAAVELLDCFYLGERLFPLAIFSLLLLKKLSKSKDLGTREEAP